MTDGKQVWAPNLTWVTPALAVGGSFPVDRSGDLARGHGIRAVVDLRSEDRDDCATLAQNGISFLHLPTDDHCAVSQAMLDQGVTFVRRHLNCGEHVLIHCEHGIGRSATLALCVMVEGGLPPLDALELAKSRRPRISPSPAQYEAWVLWLRRRKAQKATWEIPHFEAFKAIAYRHLNPASAE